MNITPLEDRINRLQKAAVSHDGAAKQEKAKQWAAAHEKAPDIAKMMLDFNRVFGKPAAVRVEHNGEVILQSGKVEFDDPKLWDGKLKVSRDTGRRF